MSCIGHRLTSMAAIKKICKLEKELAIKLEQIEKESTQSTQEIENISKEITQIEQTPTNPN